MVHKTNVYNVIVLHVHELFLGIIQQLGNYNITSILRWIMEKWTLVDWMNCGPQRSQTCHKRACKVCESARPANSVNKIY